MKPRSKMSRPLGPPAPLWPDGNPCLLPQRLFYGMQSEAMLASIDQTKIAVVDLTEDRDLTPTERGQQILLQGYVMRGAQLGLVGERS